MCRPINFVCPYCNEQATIRQCFINLTGEADVIAVENLGGVDEVTYTNEEASFEDSDHSLFKCSSCFSFIEDDYFTPIEEPDELAEWLKQKDMVSESEETSSTEHIKHCLASAIESLPEHVREVVIKAIDGNVHDLKANEASSINNDGVKRQIDYLIGEQTNLPTAKRNYHNLIHHLQTLQSEIDGFSIDDIDIGIE